MTASTTQPMQPVDWFAIAAFLSHAIIAAAAERPEWLDAPECAEHCYETARRLDAERLRRSAQQPKDPS